MNVGHRCHLVSGFNSPDLFAGYLWRWGESAERRLFGEKGLFLFLQEKILGKIFFGTVELDVLLFYFFLILLKLYKKEV